MLGHFVPKSSGCLELVLGSLISDPAGLHSGPEVLSDNSSHPTRCWVGLNKMTELPNPSRPGKNDTCYAKHLNIQPVYIREEKFISLTDVVTTTIMSDRPVTLQIAGQSFDVS